MGSGGRFPPGHVSALVLGCSSGVGWGGPTSCDMVSTMSSCPSLRTLLPSPQFHFHIYSLGGPYLWSLSLPLRLRRPHARGSRGIYWYYYHGNFLLCIHILAENNIFHF